MAQTVPARVQLGASTTNRCWWVDVVDPTATGTEAWVPVAGIMEFKPKPSDAGTQDDSDFDGGGYKSSVVTSQTFGAEGKVGRKVQAGDSAAYDPGQEILRKTAEKIGVGNRLKARWYEMEPNGPRVEAKTGYFNVTWSPDGGGMDATNTASFTLNGLGAPISSDHPNANDANADGQADA